MENQTLGTRIAELRKEKRLTQLELAKLLNVSDKAISKWESDKGCPSIEFLPKLSTILECSIDHIVSGKEYSPNNYNISKLWDNAKELLKDKTTAVVYDV